MVSLAVIDNGTKEPGKETSLGLSTYYSIVKQNGGHISVYSELSHGTTFKIYLPRHCDAGNSPASRSESRDLPRGKETVLVVEDEPSVRSVAALALRERGYTVLEAGNGDEALQVIQEHAGKMIHLMLTDVVMPFMGGRDLADQLRPSHPETSVLCTSGYTDHAIVHHSVLDPGREFIIKALLPGTAGSQGTRGAGYGLTNSAGGFIATPLGPGCPNPGPVRHPSIPPHFQFFHRGSTAFLQRALVS